MNSKDIFEKFTRSGINPSLQEKSDDIELSKQEAEAAEKVKKLSNREGWKVIKDWIELSMEKHNTRPTDLLQSTDLEKNVHYNAGYIEALKDLQEFVEKQRSFINNEKYYVPKENS